jgi:glycosyltransferase involved in cell wall biosynthesis
MTPRLSICIATFNRAAFIGETIESMVAQATDEIEIVIVDGGSADNTTEIVTPYRERFPNLRYFRQDTNHGVDRDFNRAVELARGEYCWLMTDDDLLKPGAIATVLGHIRKGYALIIANAEVCSTDFSCVLIEGRLPFTETRAYRTDEFERFFRETADYLSFIGAVIIRRDIWNSREKEPYFGTLFIHVGVIFQTSFPAPTLAIGEPLISVRLGNAMWTPRAFEILLFKWPDLVWSFPAFRDESKRMVTERDPWRRLLVLALYRGKGAYTLAEYRKWISPRAGSHGYKVLAWAIAATPGVLMNLLGVLFLSTIFRNYPTHNFELKLSRYYISNWLKSGFRR